MDLRLWVAAHGGTCFSMEYFHLNVLRIAKASCRWFRAGARGVKFTRSAWYGLLQPGCFGTFSVGAWQEKTAGWLVRGWLVGTKLSGEQDGWLIYRGVNYIKTLVGRIIDHVHDRTWFPWNHPLYHWDFESCDCSLPVCQKEMAPNAVIKMKAIEWYWTVFPCVPSWERRHILIQLPALLNRWFSFSPGGICIRSLEGILNIRRTSPFFWTTF